MKEIDELKQWLDDHMIEGKIIRDVVTIPGFGRCLFQDMSKREHLFKQNRILGTLSLTVLRFQSTLYLMTFSMLS